jgi:hypothetical protein
MSAGKPERETLARSFVNGNAISSNTMKKALLLLSYFSALSLSLWLARQLADSGATPETASQAYLRGDYSDALRAYESLAAVSGARQNESRQGLLRCLLMTGQYERVETLATNYLKESPELPDWHFESLCCG